MIYTLDDETLTEKLTEVLQEFFGTKTTESDEGANVTDQVELAEPLDPPWTVGDPIGVQVVTDKPIVVVQRGSVSWSGQSTMVSNGQATNGSGMPQLIVGKNVRRRSVVIVNNGALGIALSPTANLRFPTAAAPFGSPILPAGASVTLNTRAEVYAVADPASTGELVSVWEMTDEGD